MCLDEEEGVSSGTPFFFSCFGPPRRLYSHAAHLTPRHRKPFRSFLTKHSPILLFFFCCALSRTLRADALTRINIYLIRQIPCRHAVPQSWSTPSLLLFASSLLFVSTHFHYSTTQRSMWQCATPVLFLATTDWAGENPAPLEAAGRRSHNRGMPQCSSSLFAFSFFGCSGRR